MSFVVTCPCGLTLSVDDRAAGKMVRCSRCRSLFPVGRARRGDTGPIPDWIAEATPSNKLPPTRSNPRPRSTARSPRSYPVALPVSHPLSRPDDVELVPSSSKSLPIRMVLFGALVLATCTAAAYFMGSRHTPSTSTMKDQVVSAKPTELESKAPTTEAPDLLQQQLQEEQEQKSKQEQQRKIKQEQERAEWHREVVPIYARQVGKQIMNKVGGGQDMHVQVDSWRFNSYANQLVIDMTLSFNGLFNRNNNYQVSGTLTVNEHGQGPRFSRTSVNEKFRTLERNLVFLEGAAIVLDELNRELNK